MSTNTITRDVLPILVMGALAFIGCSDKSATKTTTRTDSKKVGSTSESTTKTTTETPNGESKSTTSSYVGTVTHFKAGKSIEVMTGDQDKHAFDLDGENDVVVIDPRIAVGSKVQLVEEKSDRGARRITVTIAPPA
jgi:hypothetical protein